MTTPSQCVVSYALVATLVTFFACLLSALVLLLAPEEPWRLGYNGGPFALYPGVVLLLAAALSFLSSFLVCCGVARDSKGLLITFAVWVVVPAILAIASSGTFFGFVYSSQVRGKLKGELCEQIKYYNSSSNIDMLQQKYECCGVSNSSDWSTPPPSCCRSHNCSEPTHYFKKGCLDLLMERLMVTADAIFVVTLITAALLLTAVGVACYGAVLIRKYEDYDVL